MTAEQIGLIGAFLQTRVARTVQPTTTPLDLFRAYAEYARTYNQDGVPIQDFTREVLRQGYTYQRDAAGQAHWYVALRSEDAIVALTDVPGGRAASVRQQLETLRMETFSAACYLRERGKHDSANKTIKTFMALLASYSAEFPQPKMPEEGADYTTPTMDSLEDCAPDTLPVSTAN